MSGTRIAAIRLPCVDLEATEAFYVEAFGCVRETSETARRVIRLGDQRIELVLASGAPAAPAPSNATGFQHCAIIVADMEAAMARLALSPGWSPISRNGPEHLPQASGGATAFKFRDPDGHPLELLQFAPGHVPEIWQVRDGAVFVGIDHSAITVSETDEAIAFYRGLGFEPTERHLNRGVEQARLDGLALEEALVEVTTLRPAGGAPPHLELLCYRDPPGLSEPAPDGSVLATVLRLEGVPARDGDAPRELRDPDGHRLDMAEA
ncbi:VOC family protein [Aureimonas ureilytica]|uniref:VOC family protein n=1 Tax=Aureimonas ureilytica TaxID=401562 RepID=UPI003CF98FB6